MQRAAAAITHRLHAAIAVDDVEIVKACFSLYVYDSPVYDSAAARTDAVEVVMAAARAWAHDASIIAGSCCAIAHISVQDLPVEKVLAAVKPHERDALVVSAAARLLADHVDTSAVLDHLPKLVQAVARWIFHHTEDSNIAWYGAYILIKAGGQEPDDVKREHGLLGVADLEVALVTGAVASQNSTVHVQGQPWNTYVLSNLFPRLRARV